ncbi:MAG TPA: hypothetical protein VJN42_07030 [Candidatus Acidoferrum sp.]|nr:hypothetical protein [Candidatus Acidoferrum sp.]
MPKPFFVRSIFPIFLAVAILPCAVAAQSQDSQTQSVAEAARKARAQKKPSAKPVPVITDDNLKPPTAEQKAVEAAAEAKAQAQAASANASSPSGGVDSIAAPDEEKKKKDAAALDALKQQIAAATKDLDLLQRQFALDQETFLSSPTHDRDSAGQARLDALKQQIADKQQEVDTLKTRASALQELVGTPAPAPQNPQP